MKNYKRKSILKLLFLKVIFVGMAVVMLTIATPILAYALNSEKKVIKAIRVGEWKKVDLIFKKYTQDPVATMIMGHANLATNKNNSSQEYFASMKEEKNLKIWYQWTKDLLEKYPENPYICYLHADSLVRNGNIVQAILVFDKALELKQDFALAQSARGVAHVLNNQKDKALLDFYMATQLDPQLADAYVNLGTLNVLQEVSISAGDGALKTFNQAIKINEDFALAYNGRGCLYFGNGDYEKALDNFNKANRLMPSFSKIKKNIELAKEKINQTDKKIKK